MRFLLLFLFTLSWDTYAQAQNPQQYHLKHYTDENGLSQNSVKSIIEDDAGFLWMGTESGLVRFDGKNFRVYDKTELAINTSRIALIIRDHISSKLFAITALEECILIEKGTAKLNTSHTYNIYDRIPGSLIKSSVSTPVAEFPFRFNASIYNTFFIRTSKNNTIYITRDNTIKWYDKNNVSKQKKIKFSHIERFFSIGDRLFYLPLYNDSVRQQKNTGVVLQITPHENKVLKLTGDILKDPHYGKTEGRLFWSMGSGNIFIYLNENFYYVSLLPDGNFQTELILSDFNFSKNVIISAYYDTDYKRLFLGSSTKGLYVFTRKPFKTINADPGNDTEVYYSQFAYDSSRVITPQGYLLGEKTQEKKFPLLPLLNNDRYNILIDKRGNIWSVKDSTVNCLSPDGKSVLKKYKLQMKGHCLYEDPDGIIWIGSRGCHLYNINQNTDNIINLVSDKACGVSFMLMPKHKKEKLLLAGTYGLAELNVHNKKVKAFPELKKKYVRSLYEDKDGLIWVSTYEDGIFLLRNREIIDLPVDKNNYLKTSHCIVEDQKGYFWISTNKGLFQVSRQNLIDYADHKDEQVFYLYYGRESGFNTNEFNGGCQPCAVKLSDGNFSLPSLNGLVWFKPSLIVPEIPSSAIYIDRIELNKKLVSYQDTLICKESPDRLRIYFSTPYFGHINNVSFDYRLNTSGKQSDWINLSSERDISFTSLPAGIHQFQIRKRNSFENWDYSEVSMVIIVKHGFWQTWWFIGFMLIALFLLFFLILKLRTRYINLQNELLEKNIRQRTLELSQSITALKLTQRDLHRQTHLQKKLIAAITHDIKSPLNYLLLTTKGLSHTYKEDQSVGDLQEAINAIYSSSFQMYHFTNNLLEYAKIFLHEEKSKTSVFNLYELVEEKILIFKFIAEKQSCYIENNIDNNFLINSNKQLYSIIIHNLLDNAIKFSSNAVIHFYIDQTSDQLQLKIKDTGHGMETERAEAYNEYFSNREPFNEASMHMGLGFSIIRELLNILKAKLSIESSRNKGTCMIISFPESVTDLSSEN